MGDENDYRKFVLGMEGMSPEEIQANYTMTSKKEGTRGFTLEEASQFYNMLHKTEKAKKSFTMNDVEFAKAGVFAEKHKTCESRSALSERFVYTFIPGGIGTVVTIKCLICREEENITDFDCW